MKRIIAAVIVLLLLLCFSAASAGTSGTVSDPLISLEYITNVFSAALVTEGSDTAAVKLTEAYENALKRLDEIYKGYVGYDFAPSFTELELLTGQNAKLMTGSSFILLSGSASLDISAGTVVNTATGFEVSSGSLLTVNQRYFCTENTAVVVNATADSLGLIDGFYTTNGKLNPNKTVFRDVRKTDWFFPAVDFVYENGLFAGTSEDTFSPALPMTRAMFVTVLYRHAGKPEPAAQSSFYDVQEPAEYFYTPVAWASENSVVAGYEDGSFLPALSITREQMALIMYRYADFLGHNMTNAGSVYDSFPDTGDVASYAVDAMRWCVANGIINGSDGMLLPSDTATRAQVAQIIYNFCQKLYATPPPAPRDIPSPVSEPEDSPDISDIEQVAPPDDTDDSDTSIDGEKPA